MFIFCHLAILLWDFDFLHGSLTLFELWVHYMEFWIALLMLHCLSVQVFIKMECSKN